MRRLWLESYVRRRLGANNFMCVGSTFSGEGGVEQGQDRALSPAASMQTWRVVTMEDDLIAAAHQVTRRAELEALDHYQLLEVYYGCAKDKFGGCCVQVAPRHALVMEILDQSVSNVVELLSLTRHGLLRLLIRSACIDSSC
ncbi:hypothetical protein NL676_032943 [Syzygium grande]|nr:hypothetical protein NL676_032943 [Syzygium grande]